MNVRLAPSWRHAATRTAACAAATALVAAALYVDLGAPTARRATHQNEVARFAPTFGHGVLQLCGETTFVLAAAWFARRGLKVRL